MKSKGFYHVTLAIAFIGVLCIPQPSSAAFLAPNWGAQTYSNLEYAPSYWGGSQPPPGQLWQNNGGPGNMSASTSVGDYRGSTRSASQLQAPGVVTPTLRSDAFVIASDRAWGAWGTAFAIEEYTYTGTAPRNYTLNTNLTGTITNPYGGESSTAIWASVYVLNAENFYYSMGIDTLLYEFPRVTEKGHVGYDLRNTGTYNQTQGIDFSVTPGETFYVWARLETLAQWDGSAVDAYNTLTMSFDSNNNLMAHGAAVPLPPSLLLFAPGLAGLAALRLRRR